MSYRYRKCRVCHGAMDPGEGYGGMCDECIQKESENTARQEMMKSLFGPGMRIQFEQMEMEDFLNA